MSPEPVRTQRVGAYCFCVREGRVLLTRLSQRTSRPGAWTLPGGGVDHGEHPRDAARREAHEEAGLDVEVHDVMFVDSGQYVGENSAGQLEDHHAIRIVYLATSADTAEPQVLDVGGTTDVAAWVPLDRLGDYSLVEMVVNALERAGLMIAANPSVR